MDEDLLAWLLADPYYARTGPKSTGREHFSSAYLDDALARHHGDPGPADLLATLTELTARTVADACLRHGVDAVFASGGGVHNGSLMDRLRHHLGETTVSTTDELGLPVDAKEAFLMTLLGFLTWYGIPGTIPGCTGGARATVLGSITPGRGPLRLPEPAGVVPNRLHVARRS